MPRLRSALAVFLLAGLVTALALSFALAIANPGVRGLAALGELGLAMLAIGLVVNGAFLVVLLLAWPALARIAPRWLGDRWVPYLASGLVGLNLVWILWNRLAMVHQWASSRPFITWAGVAQNLLLAALGPLVLVAGTRLGAGRAGRRQAAVAFTLVVALTAGLLAWNRAGEKTWRAYPLERIKASATASVAAASADGTGGGPRVIVLAIDGLCWSAMTPLMKAGSLPHLARLVRDGSAGYLGNFEESLSPAVWTSIYTGTRSRTHGIHGYEKLVLPRSGAVLTDLLPMKPSINTLYGFRYLLKYLQRLGLWKLEFVGSEDRPVPAIWEILSFFEHPVVVVNPLVNRPVQPVNGAMVSLAHRPSPATLYPPALAEIWQPEIPPDQSGRTESSFEDIRRWLHEEVSFSIDLLHTFEAELGIYYSHFVDSVTHSNWDFHSRGRFLLTDLPASLTNEEWEALLLENRDDRLVRSYVEMDHAIGEFLAAYPDATYVVVSDHGWTFSGYEHFSSPDGVVILSGPGIRAGVIEEATILDVVPTVLALLEAPVSEELPGRVLEEALAVPVQTVLVDKYPAQVRLRGETTESGKGLDPEEIERLKALGYIE